MVKRIWPTAVTGEADSVSSVSALTCHIGGPNSVNPGQTLLVYSMYSRCKMSVVEIILYAKLPESILFKQCPNSITLGLRRNSDIKRVLVDMHKIRRGRHVTDLYLLVLLYYCLYLLISQQITAGLHLCRLSCQNSTTLRFTCLSFLASD